MSTSRNAIITTIALCLLAACSSPTPTPTLRVLAPTPVPPPASTPVIALPTPPSVAALFPVGITDEPLQVVSTAPGKNAEQVAVGKEQTKIIVQFNHPVVALVSVDAQKDLPQPLTISPAVSGTGEWINTSTYSFTPSQNLNVATEYKVSVAPLKDMLGQSLTGFTWSFKTASPTVINTYPDDLTKYAGVSQPITITFNTEMDRSSTESRFSLEPISPQGPTVGGQYEWQGTVMRFVPAGPLGYDTAYRATLKAGAQDTNRLTATAKDFVWAFHTVKAPGVLSTKPSDGATSSTEIRNGFTINFASPMSRDAVTVTVVPTITNQSLSWDYNSDDTQLVIRGGWLASRSYIVTISGNSQTRYGEKLGKDLQVHFTSAPLDPMVSLNVNGMMGMYDANGPQTIYTSFTNVNRIDFNLYKVSRSDFLRLAGQNRYQIWDTYRPPESSLLRQWSRSPVAPLNATGLVSTTLSADSSAKLQPGVYFLEVTSPNIIQKGPAGARQILVVSALNLAFKHTETEALVWATGLSTGKPVGNVPLTIYDAKGSPLVSGTTDSDGIFRAKFNAVNAWDSIYALNEQDGSITAATGSDWNDGINIYDFNLPTQTEAQQFYANLYTDRAIYRPGQTVYFRGIVRRDSDASYSLPSDIETVPLQLQDDQGKQIFKQDVPLTPFGTFSGEVKLSDAASIGYYNLSFQLGQDPRRFYSNAGFQVAEYRAPEFQVQVTTDKSDYINGDTIKVDVASTYFFGGSVANAKVTWRLMSDDLFFTTDKVKGYWNFIDYDLTSNRQRTGGVIKEGKGTTDAQGKLHFEVPADLKDFPLSQNFTIDAEVTDINNQAVSNRVTVPVHKGSFYIGLKPQRYVGTVGEEQGVDIITVNTKGDPAPDQQLTISFFNHQWFSVRQKREDGNFYWTSSYTDTLISKVAVTTDAQGAATAKFTPPSGGVYKIVGEGTDSAGNAVRSATYLWVASDQFVNWRIENNDRIDLVADKKQYNVGDTAEVLVPAPFKNSEALLTIERGTIRQVKRLTLQGNSQTIRIPITSDMAPNVFVSIMMAKGRGPDSPTPQFKLGYTNLSVSTTEKELQLQVTANCGSQAGNNQTSVVNGLSNATCQPGDTATFDLQASDYSGKPVAAEFSVALVDKAIQSLANETSQSPVQAFYGQRGLGVQTAASLARSVERINQQLQAEAKGGGGGAPAPEPVRRNFLDTAFWKANLVTDASGHAEVSVPLPDNLTTWNMTAKGVTAQTLVGTAKLDLLSTKPLLVRPVAPRFFVVGDKTRLEAVVNNNTDKDINADVRLDASGLTLSGSAQQPLTIHAHDKAKVSWDTVVNPDSQVSVKFSANGGGVQDALELTLPILRPSSAETVATAGQVDTKTAEQIQLPAAVDPSAGALKIDVSPSLAAASNASLDYLQSFPYDCAEQTVSKFFPNVATYQALKQLGVDRPGLRQALELNVSNQIQRLYSFQHADGGWGWWANDQSNATLTAYALYGLVSAKNAGFAIDDNVTSRAEQYLINYLDTPVDVQATYVNNEKAFVLFVLTEKGGNYTSRAVSLFDKRAALDNYGKAYLLMVLAHENQPQAQNLISELTSAAIPSATGTHWEEKHVDYWTMNTDTRSTAIIIMALSRADPKNALLTNAIRWLMVARKEGHWETTQETAWSVLGLTQYMLASGELNANYTFQVNFNAKAIGDGSVDKSNVDQPKSWSVPIKDMIQTEANNLVITRNGSTGNLYYSAYLRYFLPADKMMAMNRGILVGRQYFAVDQQTLKPTDQLIGSAKVGDYVLVKLTLIAPTDLHYLVLEDPLPAGFEAVDNTLKTATAAVSAPVFKKGPPPAQNTQESKNDYDSFYEPYWSYWAHSEIHDDRVAAFSTDLSRGTYEYSYMMRASVSGEFRTLPARAWEMYFPEVFGRSAGALFTVNP